VYATDNTSDIVASSRPAKDAAVELSGCDLSDSRGGASVDRLAAAEDGPSSDQTRCDARRPGTRPCALHADIVEPRRAAAHQSPAQRFPAQQQQQP